MQHITYTSHKKLRDLSLLWLVQCVPWTMAYTVGFAPPQVTAHCHYHTSCLSHAQLADTHAAGIMGLLWLSDKAEMPFAPPKKQARRMEDVNCPHEVPEAAREHV